jgi:hypothetical protein
MARPTKQGVNPNLLWIYQNRDHRERLPTHGTVTDPAACQPEFPVLLFRAAR